MTDFTQYSCPNCGGGLKPVEEGVLKCPYCGSAFTGYSAEQNMRSLSEYLDQTKILYVNDQRRNLYEAVHAPYINDDDIRLYATEIKKLLPEDFQANFYLEALAGDVKKTARLIREVNAAEHYDLLPPIIHFLIASLESEYHLALSDLIERAYKRRDLTLFSRFTTELETEAEKVFDGVYDTFEQRDVFIAYSSKDMDEVMSLCEALEDEGYSCFVAARNLRHGAGAVQNYERALKEAIDNCSCFLFVSSANSRSGSCDAVRKEIPYVKSMDIKKAPVNFQHFYDQIPEKYKMPRIEYRIDTDPATSRAVTQFFDGYEWAYTAEEVMDRLEEIRLSYTLQDEDEDNVPVSVPVATTPMISAQKPVMTLSPVQQTVCEHKNVTILPAVEATCTTGGKTESVRCDDCGEILRSSAPTPPKGHRFGQWREITPPTCAQEGVQERVCDCGAKEKKAIPAHGVHTPGEWKTEKEATEGVSGRKVKKCTVCKKILKEESIPALPVKQTKKTDIPQKLVYIANPDAQTCTIRDIGTCTDKDLIIPSNIDGYRVTAISDRAFFDCKSLTSVVIPDSVKSIGDSAFSDCESLTSVIIPNSVKSIGDNAFSDCKSLASIVIPHSVKSIDQGVFSGCASLESVIIPDSVTNIGHSAFGNCTSLVSISIPDSVTSIDYYAFYGCKSLASISLPNSVTTIGWCTFSDCTSLTGVMIPNSVKSIESYAFSGCVALSSVVIPDSLTSIGKDAFSGCTNLVRVRYTGTKKQWKKKHPPKNWRENSSIQLLECADGTIAF